jgi:hypothetical protein
VIRPHQPIDPVTEALERVKDALSAATIVPRDEMSEGSKLYAELRVDSFALLELESQLGVPLAPWFADELERGSNYTLGSLARYVSACWRSST